MSDPVTYTAVLPVAEETVQFASGRLAAERRRRRTGGRRRALGCYRQAVLVLRWFCGGTRLVQLAADTRIDSSAAYRYLHESIDVLTAAAPGCVVRRWRPAPPGIRTVTVDGTLIPTDRVCSLGRPSGSTAPTSGGIVVVGQARRPRGNVQVIAAPDR